MPTIYEIVPVETTKTLAEVVGHTGMDHSALITLVLRQAGLDLSPEGITDGLHFLALCNQYKLNPLTKEIYAFRQAGKLSPIVGIDGWLALANRHPAFKGHKVEFQHDEKGALVSCTVTIKRADREWDFVHTEWLAEAQRPTGPWKSQPHRMLQNRTEAQAIRRAFGIGGIYLNQEEAGAVSTAEEVRSVIAEVADSKPVPAVDIIPVEGSVVSVPVQAATTSDVRSEGADNIGEPAADAPVPTPTKTQQRKANRPAKAEPRVGDVARAWVARAPNTRGVKVAPYTGEPHAERTGTFGLAAWDGETFIIEDPFGWASEDAAWRKLDETLEGRE